MKSFVKQPQSFVPTPVYQATLHLWQPTHATPKLEYKDGKITVLKTNP